MDYPYPESLPIEDVSALVNDARALIAGNEPADSRNAAIKRAHTVLSFGLGKAFPVGLVQPVMGSCDDPGCDGNDAGRLCTIIETELAPRTTEDGTPISQGILTDLAISAAMRLALWFLQRQFA